MGEWKRGGMHASAGLAAAVKKYPAPGVSEVPAAPKSSPTGNEPAIPSGAPAKKTGTNEDRDAVIAKIKKAKDIDTLVDLILNAGEFDWTPADLGAINATYHECAEGLK